MLALVCEGLLSEFVLSVSKSVSWGVWRLSAVGLLGSSGVFFSSSSSITVIIKGGLWSSGLLGLLCLDSTFERRVWVSLTISNMTSGFSRAGSSCLDLWFALLGSCRSSFLL